MHVVSRQATESDYPAVVRLQALSHQPPVSLESWTEFWRLGAPFGVVLEDVSRPAEHRVLAVLVATFVTDGALQTLATGKDPSVADSLREMEARGQHPFVPEPDIARGNGGKGLNLLFPFAGWVGHHANSESSLGLRALALWAFADRHSGYRLKSVTGLAPGQEAAQVACNMGFEIVNEYPHWGVHRSTSKPVLVSSMRSAGTASGNPWLGRLFTYYPPRFHFTESQRSILLLARDGYTDVEIAEWLAIRPDAVKKRWNSIYPRVASLLPGLLPNGSQSGRGQEKRRVLLMHLRDRPEELRPYARSASRRSGGYPASRDESRANQ